MENIKYGNKIKTFLKIRKNGNIYNLDYFLSELKEESKIYHSSIIMPLISRREKIEDDMMDYVRELRKNSDKLGHKEELDLLNKKKFALSKEKESLNKMLKDPNTSFLKKNEIQKRIKTIENEFIKKDNTIDKWAQEIEIELKKMDSIRSRLEPIYKKIKEIENYGILLNLKIFLIDFSVYVLKYGFTLTLFVITVYIDEVSATAEKTLNILRIKDLHIIILLIAFLFQLIVLDKIASFLKTKLAWLEYIQLLKNFIENYRTTSRFIKELEYIEKSNSIGVPPAPLYS